MKSDTSSSEWSMPEVLARLRAKVGKGEPVEVQVFLHDDTPSDSLPDLAKQIVESAKKKVGAKAAAEVGKVHQLAKSFSLKADVDTLAALSKAANVKTILPSEVDDILPRPVKVEPT